MTSEIICTLIATGGTVLSILASIFVSRTTASGELSKMKLTWEREDALSSGRELEELATLIYNYTTSENPYLRIPAMAKLASIRANETGDVSGLLDNLHVALSYQNKPESERLLSEIVVQLRKSKGNSKRNHHSRPSR